MIKSLGYRLLITWLIVIVSVYSLKIGQWFGTWRLPRSGVVRGVKELTRYVPRHAAALEDERTEAYPVMRLPTEFTLPVVPEERVASGAPWYRWPLVAGMIAVAAALSVIDLVILLVILGLT